MAKNFNVKIQGASEMSRLLDQLPAKFSDKEIVRVLRKEARPIIKDARRFAPKNSGRLKKSLAVRKNTNKRFKGRAEVIVGARVGKGKNTAPHAHLIEFGTIGHFTFIDSKKVLSDGTRSFGIINLHPGNKPHPFLRPAFEKNKQQFFDNVGLESMRIIKKALRLKRSAGQKVSL